MLKVLKMDWRNGWQSVRGTLLLAAIVSVVFGSLAGFYDGEVALGPDQFGVFVESNSEVVGIVLSVSWCAVMVALLVLTVDTIVKNMSNRMFEAAGYLTHTLPVSTWELLTGKALGTWLFGVFMVFVAFASLFLVLFTTTLSSVDFRKLVETIAALLPKLGSYHFRQMAIGAGYVLYALGAFLAWSLLLVVQFQFICIAARQFGKYHIAGGVIVFCVLLTLEGKLNNLLSMGFLVCLLFAAACFYGSYWLLKNRLSL